MKNSRLFPFERNNYYYGKLLSVDDFELEQKYVNDKRRAINRFLYGSGIVAGMYVLQVDDFTVSVERGMALDYSGREIVIDNPVIKRMSMLEGYDACSEEDKSQGYLYLCLEYAESQEEPVYNVAGKNAGNMQEKEYNKIREGYRLFLTDQEPETDNLSQAELYTDIQTIYWGNGIRIRQRVSRFVRAGGTAEVSIEVENMGQQHLFAFSYSLKLSCLSWEGKSTLKVAFNEALMEKAETYTLTYQLDAHDIPDTEGSLLLEEDSFVLSVEQKQMEAEAKARQIVLITAENEKQEVSDYYYRSSMETVLKNNFQQSIYLAKISFIRAGGSYLIQRVENVPFDQYITNNVLNGAINQMLCKDMERIQAGKGGGKTGENTAQKEEKKGRFQFAQGETEISFGERFVKGKTFFSQEIVHGLGVGQASIILSAVRNKDAEIYGNMEVFEDTKILLAAKLNRESGSFVIGARAVEECMETSVQIHWTVLKEKEETAGEKEERRIFIKPNVLHLKVRESHPLEAVCTNMKDKRLKWSVGENCGTVDDSGMYTAPNESGVFEVCVQSVAYQDVKASIFVIVREQAEE